jgi:hypothetical protein
MRLLRRREDRRGLACHRFLSIKAIVTGVLLGRLDVGGARMVAPVKVALISASFMTISRRVIHAMP